MKAAILFAMLIAGISPAMAQTPRPRVAAPVNQLQQFNDKLKADFSKTTGVPATGDLPFDLLKALDKALLPDLNYALLLAKATGSNVTAPCYQAWINVITVQNTAVQSGTPPTDIAVPDPHLITDFERVVEIRNMLQPDSPFMTACSPVANMVKLDVTNFMALVISGGAGLATLVPGL